MRTRIASACFVFASALTLLACSNDNAPSKSNAEWLTSTPISLRDDWKVAGKPNGTGAWIAYYQGKSSLFLQAPGGAPQNMVDGNSGAAPSGLALAINTANIPALMWRDKVPDKGLYFKQGETAAIELGVNGFDTEPLARFDVKPSTSSAAQQGWHVLWYGEHLVPEVNSKYNLYYRYVDAAGKPSETQRLMPGFYPQWIVTDSNQVAVFSWDNTQRPPQILMRTQDQASGQFAPSKVIATTTPDIPPIFRTHKLGKRWMVTWIDQQGDNGADFLLRGKWSDDQGASWYDFDFPSIKGFDISDVRIAHNAATGHAALAISGTWRFKDPAALNMFYVALSSDNGATWSEPKVIRDAAANKISRADAAQVFFGDAPGSTWVVWEDWRDIRGRLYVSYSEDYGLSWKVSNQPLAGQPDGNNLLAFNRENSYRDTKGLHIVAENVTNDAGQEKRIFALSLNAKALNASAKAAPIVAKGEDALQARVKSYWKAMAESNFEDTYAQLDPFMRSAWPIEIYKQRLGRIKYKPDVVIESVDIQGKVAEVILRIRAFVPEFEMGGKKHSAPEREVTINERWVFVDGNWFREYSEEGSEIRFTRYR